MTDKKLTPQEVEKIKQNMSGYIFYTPFEAMRRITEIMQTIAEVTK
jgi:hypothetical protein